METLVIRSAIVYEEPSKEVKQEGEGGGEERANAGYSQETKSMITEHMKFIKRINAAAKWDKVIVILGMIVNLFSADRAGLHNRDAVNRAAHRYAQLLQSYLKSKYSFSEVRMIYPEVMLTLSGVRAYGEVTSQRMLGFTLSDLEPLMREMFSMR